MDGLITQEWLTTIQSNTETTFEVLYDVCDWLYSITQLLAEVVIIQLFCIGVIGAVFVCFILYKFLKAFY